MPQTRDATAIRLGSGQTPVQLHELTVTQDLDAQDRAATLSRPRELPPASVPGYTFLRSIGDGAYGSVWLAREQNTGKQVAIKFYTHRRGIDWSLLNREVEKLAVLYTSRNIIGLIDVGWDSDPPYYVMEYLENGSLAGFLAGGPLPAHEAVRIAGSVLHALVHAHGSGILHCDLKPANILLDKDFEPRLCDFGQSRLTHEQYPALGTLFYMAPEQASLTAVPDARWDVYALGALLYHMLTGEPPHRTPEHEARIREATTLEERLAVYRTLLEGSPKPTKHRRQRGVDRPLADIVDRCLRVDPQKRFANAQAVLDALEQREKQRARRPLIGLGIIGPVLLLISMASVFGYAMHDAVQTAQSNLIDRASESDRLSAELLARGLQGEIDDRIEELRHVADDPDVRSALLEAQASNWNHQDSLWKALGRQKERIDQRRKKLGRRLDASWILNDAQGIQRWRDPLPPEERSTIGQNFSFRDYFHGQNREYRPDEPHEGVEPIHDQHVSLAFKSQVTGRYTTALSVPVWDAAHEKVIGVLARTTQLNELLDDYGEVIRGNDPDDINRVIALIDRRETKLLDHPWMTTENLQKLSDEDLAKLKIPVPVVMLLQETESAPNGRHVSAFEPWYRDPVAEFDPEHYGGDWLAAFAPVGGTDWTAAVQEKRREAVRPVTPIRASLREHGLVALGVCCVLVPLVWWFVMRGLNEPRTRIAGRRADGGSPSTGTTSGVHSS